MIAHAATAARVAARERVLAQPVLDGLFLATVLTVTFHKLQWELAGSLTLSDVLTSVFLVVFCWDRLERGDTRLTRTAVVALGFLLAFALVYLAGFYCARHVPGARAVGEGHGQVRPPLRLPGHRRRAPRPALVALLLAGARRLPAAGSR